MVRNQFTELSTIIHQQASEDGTETNSPPLAVADALERFLLWAGNLGALRIPTSRLSLDYRLSEAEDLRDYIFRELDDLLETLHDRTSPVPKCLPGLTPTVGKLPVLCGVTPLTGT